MKYKGIELKEVTEPQLFVTPKDMLVWDDDDVSCCPSQTSVCAIVTRRQYPVITVGGYYQHCAYIPKSKSKPVTHRELSRWLAKGNGEVMGLNTVYTEWRYINDDENEAIDESLYARKWDDTEWHKPTREYLGLEDK